MLYELLYPLREHLFFFNVFRYITFRAAYAAVTAFLLTMLLGPWFIAKLRERGVVKHIRQEGPEAHQSKTGTPTNCPMELGCQMTELALLGAI